MMLIKGDALKMRLGAHIQTNFDEIANKKKTSCKKVWWTFAKYQNFIISLHFLYS